MAVTQVFSSWIPSPVHQSPESIPSPKEHLIQLSRMANGKPRYSNALSGTRITDAGLNHLSGLTNMKRLGLFGTRVTETGVDAFRRAHPDCRVFRSSEEAVAAGWNGRK